MLAALALAAALAPVAASEADLAGIVSVFWELLPDKK